MTSLAGTMMKFSLPFLGFLAILMAPVSYFVHALEIKGSTLELVLYFAAPFYTFLSSSVIIGIWWLVYKKNKACPPPPVVNSGNGGIEIQAMNPQVGLDFKFETNKEELLHSFIKNIANEYQDKVVWIIESLLLFNHEMSRATSLSDLFIAFVRAYRDFSGKPLSSEVISYFTKKCVPTAMTPQAGLTEEGFLNFIESTDGLKTKFKNFSQSPFFHHSGKLLTLLVMVGLVNAPIWSFLFINLGSLRIN